MSKTPRKAGKVCPHGIPLDKMTPELRKECKALTKALAAWNSRNRINR